MAERRTAFYDNHVRLGAEMIKGGGDFMFPKAYTTTPEEHFNTRTNLGMQDLSTMGKVDIKGPDAEKLVNYLLVNDVCDMTVGQIRYSTVCREDGGILDDVTVYKLGNEQFIIVTGSANREKMVAWITNHTKGDRAYVTDITAALALPVIQGPNSRDYLKSVVHDADLDSLKYFRFTKGRIGETLMIISRTGITGELGYELYVPAEEAPVLWDTIMETGSDFGLQPFGVVTMLTLALEKGYPIYGRDMDESHTPFHVGLDRWIKFDNDFIGREALLQMRETGASERWIGLIVEGDKIAGAKDPVFKEEKEVGYVTYSNKGYTVGKILATAYVKSDYTPIDTNLTVLVDGERTPAKVSRMPFYDPEGIRLKS